MFGFNFNPRGWAFCNGATLPISQNTALFALLGITYGGNGQTTFQLPNFAARAGMCYGQGPGLTPRTQGQTAGQTAVTLSLNQIPVHRHVVRALTVSGTHTSPAGTAPAAAAEEGEMLYGTTTDVAMSPIGSASGGTAHENQQPYLGVNFCIALQGIFPSFA